MKFKFVGNHPHYDDTVGKSREEWCVLNMAFFFIKHFYDLHGLNKNLVWLDPEIICLENFDNQIKKLTQESPDILALSCFIWNQNLQFKIAESYKKINPKVVIVMGGPQLTAHKDNRFFEKYPFVDYVIFGDGEKAVQQIIDFESGLVNNKNDFINIVNKENGTYKKYPYEQINDHLYLSTSPYLNQKDIIIKYIKKLENHGIGIDKIKIAVEFARGCMYTCTFCNWSQMLDTKVKRRSASWKDELNFFKELDVSIRETDANFGQWDEDLKIFDYANSLYDPEKNFNFIPKHTPKFKKSATYYIMKEVLKKHHDKVFQVFSFQDINDDVLEAIDRPSKTFNDHVILAQKLKKEVGTDISEIILAMLMIGLPGQTFDSFCETVKKIWNTQEFKRFGMSHWEFLPNSPAADPSYVEKYKVKTIPVMSLLHNLHLSENPENLNLVDQDTIYQKVSEQKYINHYFSESNYVFSTKDMSFMDMHACKFFIQTLNEYALRRKNKNFEIQDLLFQTFKKLSVQKSLQLATNCEKYIQKYKFVIHARFDKEKNMLVPSCLPLDNF